MQKAASVLSRSWKFKVLLLKELLDNNTVKLSFDIALLTASSEVHLHASVAQMQ